MSVLSSKLVVLSELDRMEYLSTRLKSHRFPIHFHETFVIQMVGVGADWCCVNELAAQQREVFVHFPFAAHTGGSLDDSHVEYRAIYPSLELFCELTGTRPGEVHRGQSFVIRSAKEVQLVSDLLDSIGEGGSHQRARKLLRSVFFAVLEMQRHDEGEGKRARLGRQLESARRYLVENARRDVSLPELSANCGISRFHLIRAFKKRFGITPRRFLMSRRVTIAKELMAEGVSLVQTAQIAGFHDQSHLTRCFKQVTTFSPGQFRLASNV